MRLVIDCRQAVSGGQLVSQLSTRSDDGIAKRGRGVDGKNVSKRDYDGGMKIPLSSGTTAMKVGE